MEDKRGIIEAVIQYTLEDYGACIANSLHKNFEGDLAKDRVLISKDATKSIYEILEGDTK